MGFFGVAVAAALLAAPADGPVWVLPGATHYHPERNCRSLLATEIEGEVMTLSGEEARKKGLVPHPCQPKRADPGGWGKLKWGAVKKTFARAYPEATKGTHGRPSVSVELGGHPATAHFDFMQHGLWAVGVVAAVDPADARAAARVCDDWAAHLRSTHGTGAEEQSKETFRALWLDGSRTAIELLCERGPARHRVRVLYEGLEKRGSRKARLAHRGIPEI
ncbi:MAG TPA: hypothetical protein VFM29_06340 [Vicinamibacteria bacterium]|nr:hypothetical protein [Vicinamibacteria bacterium]